MANLVRLYKSMYNRKSFNRKLERKWNLRSIFQGKTDTQIKRITNICTLTGAGKSVYRHVRISRHMLKRYANQGKIMGFRKSSW